MLNSHAVGNLSKLPDYLVPMLLSARGHALFANVRTQVKKGNFEKTPSTISGVSLARGWPYRLSWRRGESKRMWRGGNRGGRKDLHSERARRWYHLLGSFEWVPELSLL